SRQTDLVFVKSSAENTKVSILGVERPWLSKSEGFTLPNHDTGRILSAESQVKITYPLVAIIDSSATKYDSADESSVCSTPLPPLEKLTGVEPIYGPKTIKLILKSNSTFKPETSKGVTINKPFLALAKDNKNVSASKRNLAPTGKLKNVKNKDDIPLSIVIKELNDLKLRISKNQSSYSKNHKPRQIPQNKLKNKYKTQLKKNYELCGLNNHLFENCYKVLFCKKYERTDHRTYDYVKYMSTMNMTQHLKSQGGSSSRSKTSRPSKPFPPCIHCGFNDHLSDDCVNYLICDICGSYDHETHGHKRVISLRRGIKPRNPQQVTKSCETCGSTVHTTTDYNDIEWFRRGEAIQAKKAEAFQSKNTESSNSNKSKTPTNRWVSKQNEPFNLFVQSDIRKPIWHMDNGCSRHMTGVKSYLHKYVKQPGPKVVFGDDSTCITEGYGFIKCNAIVFTKVAFVNGLKYNLASISQLCDAKYIVQFDEKRGTIFNSNKEIVMIAPRVRDVYVLDMTSSTQESCFFAKAIENLN
ncbi:hypothetical protein Tco_1461336, partial [Tanacetum coccineum]